MGLAHILYPSPSHGGFQAWLLHHFQHHQAIIDGLRSQRGIVVPMRMIYRCDPQKPEQLAVFLEQHQQLHVDMDGALGISGNDLSDVDFQDKKQTDAFFWLQFQEHLAAATNLGIPI